MKNQLYSLTFPPFAQRALPVVLILFLNGCAYIPHKPLVDGVTTATPTPSVMTTANGSVFQTGQAMGYG